MSETEVRDLRDRVVRIETLLENMAAGATKQSSQIDGLFRSVRVLEKTVATSHAARSAESQADRRSMRFAVAALGVLWIIAQAAQMFVG